MEQITKESLEFIPNNLTISVDVPSLLSSFRLKPIYTSYIKTLNVNDFKHFIIPETITGTTDNLFKDVRWKIDKGAADDKELNAYLSIIAKNYDSYSDNKSLRCDLSTASDPEKDLNKDLNAFVMYIKSCADENCFSGYLFSILIYFYIFDIPEYEKKRFSLLFDIKDDVAVFKRINERIGFHFLSENINSNEYTDIISHLESMFPSYKQHNSAIKKDATIDSGTPYSFYSDVVYLLASMTRIADLYFLVNDNEMNVILPPACCLQPHEFTFSVLYSILCFINKHYMPKINSYNLEIDFKKYSVKDKDMDFNGKDNLIVPIITMLFQLLAYNLKSIPYSKQSYEDVGLACRINKEETEKHQNITLFLECFLNLLEQFYKEIIKSNVVSKNIDTIKESIEYSYRELIKCLFFNDLYNKVIERIEICKDEVICRWIVDSIETCHPDLFLYEINYNPNPDPDRLHNSIYSVSKGSEEMYIMCFENLKENLHRMQIVLSMQFADEKMRHLYISRDKYIELYNTMQTWFLKIQGQYFDSTPETFSKIEMLGSFQPIGQNMSSYIFNYPIYPNTGIHTFVYRFNQEDPLNVIYGLSEYIVPSKFIGFNYTGVGYHGSGTFYCKGKKYGGYLKLGRKFEPRIENKSIEEGKHEKRYNPEEILLTYDSCRGYLEIAFVSFSEANYIELYVPVVYYKVDNSLIFYPSVSCTSTADFSLVHYNNVISEIFDDYKGSEVYEDYRSNCRRSGHFNCLYKNESFNEGIEYIENMCDFIKNSISEEFIKPDRNDDEDDENCKMLINLGLLRVYSNFISQLCLYSYFPDLNNYGLLDRIIIPLAKQFDEIISHEKNFDLNEVDSDYDYTIKGHFQFLYQKTYPLPKEKTVFFNIDLDQDEIYVQNTKNTSEEKYGKREFNGRADGNTMEFTLTTELSKKERQIFTCHAVIMPSGNRFIGKYENPRNNTSGYFIAVKTFGLGNLIVKDLKLLFLKLSTKLHYLIGKSIASYSCINRITNVIDFSNLIKEKCPTIFNNNKFLFYYVYDNEKDDNVKEEYKSVYEENDKEIEKMKVVLQDIDSFIGQGTKEDLFLQHLPQSIDNNSYEWKLYRIAIGLFYYHLTDYGTINDENVKEFCENYLPDSSIKNKNLIQTNDLIYFKEQIVKKYVKKIEDSIEIKRINEDNEKNDKDIRKKYRNNKNKTEFQTAIENAKKIYEEEIEKEKDRIYYSLIQNSMDLFYFYPIIKSLPNKYDRKKIVDEIIQFLFEPQLGEDSYGEHNFLKYVRYNISGIMHYCYTFHLFEKLLIGNNQPKYAGNLYMYLNWYKRFQNYTYYIPLNFVDDPVYLHNITGDVCEDEFFLSLIGEKNDDIFKFNPNEVSNCIAKEIDFTFAPYFEKIVNESYSKVFKQLIDFLPNTYYNHDDNKESLSSVVISKYLAVIDCFYKKYTKNELKCIKENFVDKLTEKIKYILIIDDAILKKSFSFFLYTLSRSICNSDPNSQDSIGISIIEKLLTELNYPINKNGCIGVDVRDTFNEIITLDIYQDIYSPSVSILAELSNTRIVDVKVYLPILIIVFLTCNHSQLPFIVVKFLNKWLPDITNPKELEIMLPNEVIKNYIDEDENENISSSNQVIQLFLTMSGFIYPVHFGNFIKYFLKTDTYILACRVTSLLRNLQKKSESWSNIINDEINRVLIKVQKINEESIKPNNFGNCRKSLKDIFYQKDTLFYKFIGSLHVIGGNYEVLTVGSRVEVMSKVVNIPSSNGTVLSIAKDYHSRNTGKLIKDPNLDRSDGVPKESTIYQVLELCEIKLDDGKIITMVNSDEVTPIPLVNSQPYRINVEVIENLINMMSVIYTLYDSIKIVKANTDFFFIVTFMIFGTNALSHLLSNKNTIQLIVNRRPNDYGEDDHDYKPKNMLFKTIRLADSLLSSTSSLYDYPVFYEAFKELFHFWNKNEMSYISRNIEPEIYQTYRHLNSNQIDAIKELMNLAIPVEKAMKYIVGVDHPNNEEIVLKIIENDNEEEKKLQFSYIGVVSGDGTIVGNEVVADKEKYLTFTVGIPSATCVSGGKYYYEVYIKELGDGAYFGWADPAFSKTNVDEKFALGADRHSYSWGGKDYNTFKARNSQSTPTKYGLRNGDIVGCLLDLESVPNSISYCINGYIPFEGFKGLNHYEYLYPIIALRSTIDKKAKIEIRMDISKLQFIPKGYTPIVEGKEDYIKELFIKPYEEELEKYKPLNNRESIVKDNFNQSVATSSTINRFYQYGSKKTDSVLTIDTINKTNNKPQRRSSARCDYQVNLNTFTLCDSDSIVKKNVTSTLYRLEIKCFILTIRVFLLELMKYWIIYKPVDYKGNPIQCLKFLCNYDISKDSDDIDTSEKDEIYENINTFIKLCINFPLDIFASLPVDSDNDPNEKIIIPDVCNKYKDIYSNDCKSYFKTIYDENDNKRNHSSIIYTRIIEALITYDLSINHEINKEITELLLRILRTESLLSSEFENKDNSAALEKKNPYYSREDHVSYNESNAVNQSSMQLVEVITDEILNYYQNDYYVVYVIFKSWVVILQSPSSPLKSDAAAVLSSLLNHISYLYQTGTINAKDKDKWIKIVESIPHIRLKSFINKEIYRSFSNYPMHAKDVQNLYSLVVSMNNFERLLLNNKEVIKHDSSWKDGFDLGVVSDDYLVQLSGFSSKSGLANDGDYKDIEQGDYVIRGPNWKPNFFNQDGGEGSVGIVNSLIPMSLSSSKEKSYQVEVEWINSPGLPMLYYWNKDGEYEVQIVEYDSVNRKILKKLPLEGGSNKSIRTGIRLIINNNLRDENECKFDGIIEYPQYCGKIKVEGILGRIKGSDYGVERTIQFDETKFLAGKSSLGWETRYGHSHWLPIKNYNGIIKITNSRITANIQYIIETTKAACELNLSSDYLFQFMKEMSSTSQVIVDDNSEAFSYNSAKPAYIYGSCGFIHGVKYFELKILNAADDPKIGIGITSEIPVVGKQMDSIYPQFIYCSDSQLLLLRERDNLNNIDNNNYYQPNVNRNRVIPYGGLYREGDVVGVNVNSSSDKLSFTYDGKKYEIPQIYEFADATRDITVGNSYSSEWTIYPLIKISSQNFSHISNYEVKVHKWLSVEEYPSDTLLFYGEMFDYLSPYFITDDNNKQIVIPKEVISYAFRYCTRWLSNKFRRYETRTKGVYVDLNIDEKVFKELQPNRESDNLLKVGTIAVMGNKEIEILGCYRRRIWYRYTSADPEDGYSRIMRSVWYLNEDELDVVYVKKRNKLLEITDECYSDSTPFKITEAEFEEALNSDKNSKDYYMKIVKMMNKICENKKVVASNVTYKYVEKFYKSYYDKNCDNNSLVRCFSVVSVLMMLNIIIEKVLSYTEIDKTLSYSDTTFGNKNVYNNNNKKWTNYSQTNYIHQMKEYMFTLVKRSYLERIIDATETGIYYQVDDLAESNLVQRIRINRFTNVKYVQSIFHQIVSVFNSEKITDQTFRINYQGAKQGGQYRMFRVELVGEGVIDSGGVYRAIYEQMIEELKERSIPLPFIFDIKSHRIDEYPLLVKYNDKYMINFINTEVYFYKYIFYLGVLIGSAIRCRMELNIPFMPMIWKCLVGKVIDKDEIEEIIERFMYFKDQYESESYDNTNNSRNDEEIRKDVYKKIECTINQFCRGFYMCIPEEIASILNEEELERITCGIGKLNVDDLRNHCLYERYTENDRVIKDFWHVIREFNDEEMNCFMNFAWAKTRLSSNGIDFDFLIRKRDVSVEENPDDYLPSSHTCFYSLDLPCYSSKEILKKKLKYAMEEATTLDGDFAEENGEAYADMN